ncbi:MAG: MazG nucleotide pyrophosphohydrolase domain-containing protein [Acidimicrobiales bacterium]
MNRPRLTVAGLGPGGVGQITDDTRRAMERAGRCFLRTRRHPSAASAPATAEAFDHVYDDADDLASVYRTIADRLVAATESGDDVCYVVPGSPLVLERSVAHLRADDRIDVDLVPSMSFLDVAWARLAIDPVEAGVRLIDGHVFAEAAAGDSGPLLVAHAHAPWVLSDIKLAIDAGPEQRVVVLQGLGTDDERIEEVAWPDLDRSFEPDHLTSLYLPEVTAPVAGALHRSVELMRRLRAECPWDAEQTHTSLRPYLLEESHEVLEALDAIATLDPSDAGGDAEAEAMELLEEELGDLWFQVLFHAELASEAGWFTVADVASTLHDKLVGRHPHVFGDTVADDAATVAGNWERIKKDEKGRSSLLDGIPASLPALARAQKLARRVERGVDGDDALPSDDALWAALGGRPSALDEREVGRRLTALAELARRADVDAEQALRTMSAEATARFVAAEAAGTVGSSWILG